MNIFIQLALMEDVKAWESVHEEAVDAAIDRLWSLCSHLASFLLDDQIKRRCVLLKRIIISL